ncbi:MAG: hypothetical protein FWF56_03475 [Firmicutes bacterium]|nr:hypothetical protein [Bacillota bacterium]
MARVAKPTESESQNNSDAAKLRTKKLSLRRLKYNPKFPTHAYAQLIVDTVEKASKPSFKQYCQAEYLLAKKHLQAILPSRIFASQKALA